MSLLEQYQDLAHCPGDEIGFAIACQSMLKLYPDYYKDTPAEVDARAVVEQAKKDGVIQ